MVHELDKSGVVCAVLSRLFGTVRLAHATLGVSLAIIWDDLELCTLSLGPIYARLLIGHILTYGFILVARAGCWCPRDVLDGKPSAGFALLCGQLQQGLEQDRLRRLISSRARVVRGPRRQRHPVEDERDFCAARLVAPGCPARDTGHLVLPREGLESLGRHAPRHERVHHRIGAPRCHRDPLRARAHRMGIHPARRARVTAHQRGEMLEPVERRARPQPRVALGEVHGAHRAVKQLRRVSAQCGDRLEHCKLLQGQGSQGRAAERGGTLRQLQLQAAHEGVPALARAREQRE
eukprot:scaffold122711_cov69-Phaeocystis_antarctica.AAC.1